MKKSDVKKKYQDKIKEFKRHNFYYYEKSSPKISDLEFDNLKKEILDLEKNNNFLKSEESPSFSVGFKPSKNFKKFKHRVPMLSLGNAFSEGDLINFEKKNTKFFEL